MRYSSLFSAVAGGLLLLLSASCKAAVEIPFTYDNGLLWVEVTVPDAPQRLHFLLDSGASHSVLDLATARRLGTKLGASRSVLVVNSTSTAYRVSSFQGNLCDVRVPSSLLALDLGHISALCQRKVDGLLGADFFKGKIVQVDYAARKVRLLSRGELTLAGAQVLPLKINGNALCTRVSVNDEPSAWARVDTGCKTALEWSGPAPAGKRGATTLGILPNGKRTASAKVLLGTETFPDVKIGQHPHPIFPGEAGLLGNGFLSRFAKVTFDPGMKRLLLSPR